MSSSSFWSSIRARLQRLRRKKLSEVEKRHVPASADSGKVIDDNVPPPEAQKHTLTLDERLPVWTIENTKLHEFHPQGLEVDDDDDASVPYNSENPYVTNPVEALQVAQTERSWHNYKPGAKYYVPNDKTEMGRLDRQHIIWTSVLDGDLVKAPIENAKTVLDLGTGSGVWATDYARRHPESEVLGIDLSKPTPSETPPNCKFEEVDFTDPWTYTQKFDLIHGRLIFLGQSDPKLSLQRAFDQLAPGGYLEHQELYGVPLDMDGSMRGRHMESFFFDTVVASRKLGNDMMAMPQYAGWMREIGFEDVTELHYGLPLNPSWPKGDKYKSIGAMQQANLELAIGGLYTRMLTMGLGWTPEQAAEGIAKAIEDFKSPDVHAYWPIFVVYGRKPLSTAAT
ncbi:S-adenosyl-L-methionine-dependent methyltransferase [Microdochium trichocladiopsis]|uniref:S-adenosyl-L-methionine-dependent methyltransferase n=1 Tax=Microdochium trichocladiopsis TaxID=1682393 RepID=A0A9P9BT57_9PEZI|nr:S-adenosyl-L-methionine-dependent methyltransferase [Microdochium trichocladiopsis]KAH7039626.1 S-adenosyl-L-methionine-dependent methyltransferase [Microdochium trichocladiopsis]